MRRGIRWDYTQPWKGKVWNSAGATQQVRVGGLIGASWIAGSFRLRLYFYRRWSMIYALCSMLLYGHNGLISIHWNDVMEPSLPLSVSSSISNL